MMLGDKHRVVAVLWDDAHYAHDEVEAKDIIHRPWKYITTGTLILSDEEGVTMASDLGEDGKYRGRNFIPRKMIVQEWDIGPLKPRRKRQPQLAEERPPDG